ncbi:MAG: VTT domain-containing protein [Prosthecobacter sp.]|nr:VTT domain-containing protein [Prosthecobacter sp.]
MALRRGTWAFGLLILLLLIGIIVPFLIWGQWFDAVFSLEGTQQWMRQYGTWAWLAGIVLLVADIVLPIPSTVVMSALGWMYGWFWGGLAASAGAFLSGIVAYGLCRWLGRPVARRIAGEEGLRKGEQWFAEGGGWLVALSRWMPVLPEAVACLAGLAKMPWRAFVIAVACGSLPMGFAFAAIGAVGHGNPGLAITLSAAVPVGLWLMARRALKRR